MTDFKRFAQNNFVLMAIIVIVIVITIMDNRFISPRNLMDKC